MAESGEQGRDRRNELAEQRTEDAYRRTQLANERTFSAWVRTGLALLVAGFAATRLLNESGPAWLITTVGIAFTVLGAAIFVAAYWSYHKASEIDVPGLSRSLIGLIAALLVVLSGVAVFLLMNARSDA